MKKKTFLAIAAAVCAVLCIMVLLLTAVKPEQNAAETQIAASVDSWEAYQALSPEEQEAFFQQFDSAEAFEAWLESVKPAETTLPDFVWNKEGKQPDAYTWEEYQALTLEDQESFFLWFGSEAAFEAWRDSVKTDENTLIVKKWNKPGKLPTEYTWEEFQALPYEEQESFYQWFESAKAFDDWVKAVKPLETKPAVYTWNQSGKKPDEYTWNEYQALSSDKKEAFYQWFGSVSAFERWMDAVKPVEATEEPDYVWDQSGKTPEEYTWKEYQELSGEEQEAFYRWFKSESAFEAWMESAKAADSAQENADWNKFAKQPDTYTWEEYQRLSPEEQDFFYQWFGSVEDFETWMNQVKPAEGNNAGDSWNKPGKKPDEYSWQEYEALSTQEQELFYQWFGSVEAFEAWMDMVKPEEDLPSGGKWDKPGKLPNEYTKEEYLALTPMEQDAFFQWFESLEAFEAWVSAAEG